MSTPPATPAAPAAPADSAAPSTRISIDRIVAWAGPWIALISSSIAAWLIAKVDVLGIPGLDKNNLATYLTAGITFGVVAGLHALGGWQWLRGRHIMLEQGDPNA